MTRRVAVAGLYHETNTFASRLTDRAAFERGDGWVDGDRLPHRFIGTRTVMGGMLEEVQRQGSTAVPIFGAYATPAGTVTREAFDAVTDRIVQGLRDAGDVDGVSLELHGAMVVDGCEDPETLLLDAVREVVGDRPIATATDLHANMTRERLRRLDVLVGFRTNPHVDTYEAGADAVRHLHTVLESEQTTELAHARADIVAPPVAQATAELPLLRVVHRARELERRHRLMDVTVHGGFAHADVAHAGLSITVTAPARAAAIAQEAADELVALAWRYRREFEVELPDAAEAIEQAQRLRRDRGGPIAVADTGDNINGGGAGDATWLLAAALAVPGVRVVATVWDPAAVEAASAAGPGASIDLDLAGRGEELGGDPLPGRYQVRSLGDGGFTNTGPMDEGAAVTMGPTAVLTTGSVDILVQSLPVQPNDPEMFRSVGLHPGDYDLVLLKGAAAIRAGWSPLVQGFVDAGTRGVTDGDLSRLPYQRLRGVWPLHDPT